VALKQQLAKPAHSAIIDELHGGGDE